MPLAGPASADVVVIGAGITGLATAAMAAGAGARVLVLEDRDIGVGATGFSTAKVTSLHGLKYAGLARTHGVEVAARYATAQEAGRRWIVDRCPGAEEATAVTYATDDATRVDVEEEAAAAAAAGLPVALVDDLDVPFEHRGAVTLSGQHQVAPMALLSTLADAVEAAGGRVVVGTRATGVHDGRRGATVRTPAGEVHAGWVVVATGLPFLDRSLLFARTEPKASYVLALRVDGPVPSDMYLSAGEPVRSLRTAPDPERDGERLLLVGGESHKTGNQPSTLRRYQALLDWAAERFTVVDVVHRWSAEDFVPDDSLPFVGPVWPLPTRILVATGFAKWGFTNGVAAAMALAARATGGEAPAWADDWDTRRADVRHGARELARANADVARKLVGGWTGLAISGHPRSRRGGVCTHLGGIVRWNDGDGCWDCPLHGSRFADDGTVLHGPAVKDLASRTSSRTDIPSDAQET